jgi:hypothetical protein
LHAHPAQRLCSRSGEARNAETARRELADPEAAQSLAQVRLK